MWPPWSSFRLVTTKLMRQVDAITDEFVPFNVRRIPLGLILWTIAAGRALPGPGTDRQYPPEDSQHFRGLSNKNKGMALTVS
jgi:hypothetical protein